MPLVALDFNTVCTVCLSSKWSPVNLLVKSYICPLRRVSLITINHTRMHRSGTGYRGHEILGEIDITLAVYLSVYE